MLVHLPSGQLHQECFQCRNFCLLLGCFFFLTSCVAFSLEISFHWNGVFCLDGSVGCFSFSGRPAYVWPAAWRDSWLFGRTSVWQVRSASSPAECCFQFCFLDLKLCFTPFVCGIFLYKDNCHLAFCFQPSFPDQHHGRTAGRLPADFLLDEVLFNVRLREGLVPSQCLSWPGRANDYFDAPGDCRRARLSFCVCRE